MFYSMQSSLTAIEDSVLKGRIRGEVNLGLSF